MAPVSYSLRRRLLLWLLVPLLAVGAVTLFDTWGEAVLTANSVSDRVLAGSALAIAERVVVNENGALEVDVPYVALEMLTSAAQDRVFYRVDGPPGTFITGYQTLPGTRPTSGEISYSDANFRGEPIRVAVLERAASSGVSAIPFVVTVAETTIARTELARSILLRSAIRLGLVILAAASIVWFAVSFALRPLRRLRDAIERRNPGDLHPIEQSVPREVESLVVTVNSFMGRLGGALEALRHFTGNASHQLRTPLAIVRTQLELARRATSPEEAAAATRAADQAVVHAERVLAQLLLMARIDEVQSDRLSQSPVDLFALAQQLTLDNVVRAQAAGVDLGFEGLSGPRIGAEPLLISELLLNLIDNAVRYAGAGSEVTVRVRTEAENALLEVEDNGRGMGDEDLAAAGRRFAPRSHPSGGAGLGLAIVREIAEIFGGTLTLTANTPRPGLRVRVTWPLAPSPG